MPSKHRGRWLVFLAACAALGPIGSGCVVRPVGTGEPSTKLVYQATVSQQQIDKVDMLFMIDNSASMADKQQILAQAVPNILDGLLRPKCVDGKEAPLPGGELADPLAPKDDNGKQYGCPPGSHPEFAPITDMHIGVISSSLGGIGGDVCSDTGRENDRAHFLRRANPANSNESFLSWFPAVAANEDPERHPAPASPIRDIPALTSAFEELLVGVDQKGCGLEAQLESVYRFLVQPDPWVKVGVDRFDQAVLGSDVDVELLKQRAEFLRPDSLVAVVMLTDEDDSSADPLAVGGQGWAFMSNRFPSSKVFRNGTESDGTTAPRATSACTAPGKGPMHRECTSCGFQARCDVKDPECQRIRNDPNCKEVGAPPASGQGPSGYAGYFGPTDDSLNVRFHRMKERFGIDPQFPIQRYVDGFTKLRVPNRKTEHVVEGGEAGASAPRRIQGYTSTPTCANPLFAKSLPRKAGDEICNLERGGRSPEHVFFAVVGGVPHELLHFTPGDPEKSKLTAKDFEKIVGRDPVHYDYANIDPHMIQSTAPRPGIAAKASETRGDNGRDAMHGREWETQKNDLQYACTFALNPPRTCTSDDNGCDCGSASVNPPLCGPTLGEQVRAKAYPTIRELTVVKELGNQGIAASLCPIQLTEPSKETYGYKPAVSAIIERLKDSITSQCVQKLSRDSQSGEVPCRVLALLDEETDTCERHGLAPPPNEIVDVFRQDKRAESGDTTKPGARDLSVLPVCDVPQLAVPAGESCKDSPDIRWCYVENAGDRSPAKRCSQAILLSSGTGELRGARFSVQCISN